MNELIFELAKQADLIQWDILPSGAKTPDHISVVKARKFAELIVRECAACGSKAMYPAFDSDYVGRKIKEHFGIEE